MGKVLGAVLRKLAGLCAPIGRFTKAIVAHAALSRLVSRPGTGSATKLHIRFQSSQATQRPLTKRCGSPSNGPAFYGTCVVLEVRGI